jgi:hypothetical protein
MWKCLATVVKFSEGRNEVSNLPHVHIQPEAVGFVNIYLVQELILGNRQITVNGIASNNGTSFRIVDTITHVHLLFKKLCAHWVLKMLIFD